MKKIIFSLFFCICSFAFAQNDAEEARLNTIKYGTETEIASLIQALTNEGADYLDNEIIALVENTRNQKIVGGAFTFFGNREKSGLEDRAMRAIDERDYEENETVHAAIDYLGKVKAAQATPVLRDLLESGERRFMNGAFRALGRVSSLRGTAHGDEDSDDTAEYLVDFYENRDPGDDNRRELITAMGATGSAMAVEFLAGIASHADERPVLRMAALEALSKIGDTGNNAKIGLDAILSCVTARDPNIRSAAVGALGPFSGKAVDDAILDAFRDSFYRTRIAAAQASRQRKLAVAIPYLKFRAERDDVPQVREESIKALGEIANEESMKILEELFTERKNSERVRIAAGDMLMQKEPDKNLNVFVRELDEAKQKNQTNLYNNLLRIISKAKCSNMEDITQRLMKNPGMAEKLSALEMASNNNLTSLADEIKILASDRNETLSRRARQTLEKLGIEP